jgi:hypothetical protein
MAVAGADSWRRHEAALVLRQATFARCGNGNRTTRHVITGQRLTGIVIPDSGTPGQFRIRRTLATNPAPG